MLKYFDIAFSHMQINTFYMCLIIVLFQGKHTYMQINTFYMFLIIVYFQEKWMLLVSDSSQDYKKLKMAHQSGGIMKKMKSLGAHFEKTNCVHLITKRCYQPGITVDVAKYLASCHRYQVGKFVKLQKVNNVLHPITVSKRYFCSTRCLSLCSNCERLFF